MGLHTLTFTAPARHAITQSIPLPNPSLQPWQWRARIDGSDAFKGDAVITVPAQNVAHYSLSFSSHSVQSVRAKLVLKNRQTGDELSFALTGDSVSPQCDDVLSVMTQARTMTHHTVTIRNDSQSLIEYRVDSDLPALAGASLVRVSPQSKVDYSFTLLPLLSGVYPGTLSFTGYYDGRQVTRWYAVKLHVAPPAPESTLVLECAAHSSVKAEMEIVNPSTTESVDFVVEIDGKTVSGENSISIEAGGSTIYELEYAPHQSGESTGKISFIHPIYGEYLYNLTLVATPSPTIELADMRVELGHTDCQAFMIHNPTTETIKLKAALSDSTAWACVPSTVTIAPMDFQSVTLSYSPTLLHVPQECMLTFSHSRAGEWRYHCQGQGLAPLTEHPARTLASFCDSPNEKSIIVKNPFNEEKEFLFQLVSDSDAWTVLDRDSHGGEWQWTSLIAARASMTVTVCFTPALITTYRATLLATATNTNKRPLQWKFPLVGVGEGLIVFDHPLSLQCPARQCVTQRKSVTLPGLPSINDSECDVGGIRQSTQSFSVRVEADNDDSSDWLERSLSVHLLNSTLSSNTDPLTLEFVFAPLKPLTTQCAVVINKHSGGSWRFPVRLTAITPPPDDELMLEAAVGASQSAQFAVRNLIDRAAKYRAYLNTSSSPFFSVSPKTGRLPPLSASVGQLFTVTFAPLEYGKEVHEAIVVIETDEAMMRFDVKGRPPKYKAPKVAEGRVKQAIKQQQVPSQPD